MNNRLLPKIFPKPNPSITNGPRVASNPPRPLRLTGRDGTKFFHPGALSCSRQKTEREYSPMNPLNRAQ